MANTTLSDILEELQLQTEFQNLQIDNIKEFTDAFLGISQSNNLNQLEASKEGGGPDANFASGGTEDVGDLSGEVDLSGDVSDIAKPSTAAGMILALGTAGLGLGAAAAGIAFLVSQINSFGPALSNMSTGLEDLENTEVSGAQFQKLGTAIGDLVAGAGIGGAIGVRILAGTAFDDLATGIDRLNQVDFDPGALAAVGEGLNAMLSPLSAGDVGEAGVLQMLDDNLVDLADGITALAAAPVPSVEKMKDIGEGLNAILSPLSAGDVGEASVLQMIDDNLVPIAQGLGALMSLGPGVEQTGQSVGNALQAILDGTDDLAGASGLQMIDDNLKPLADAIAYMSAQVTPEVLDNFDFLSRFIGPALERLLDGTDDLLGAVGLQSIDDNLKPMADGIKYMSDVGNTVDREGVKNIVDAYNELDNMKVITDSKVKNLATLLGAIGSGTSAARTAVISNNTQDTSAAPIVVNNVTNAPTSVNNTSSVTQGNVVLSPTNGNGSRADAYAAA